VASLAQRVEECHGSPPRQVLCEATVEHRGIDQALERGVEVTTPEGIARCQDVTRKRRVACGGDLCELAEARDVLGFLGIVERARELPSALGLVGHERPREGQACAFEDRIALELGREGGHECGVERGLSPRKDRYELVLTRVGQVGLEPRANLFLRERSHELGRDLTRAEHLDRRDAHHAPGRRELGVLFDVELDELPATFGLACERVEHGAEHAARRTPRGPEVDDHGDDVAALEDVSVEVHGDHRVAPIVAAG